MPHGAVTVFFCVQKGRTQINVRNQIELSYFDPKLSVRLTAYADTIVLENTGGVSTIVAIRFGGYPEMVRAMWDAIYGGGATVDWSLMP